MANYKIEISYFKGGEAVIRYYRKEGSPYGGHLYFCYKAHEVSSTRADILFTRAIRKGIIIPYIR